MNCKMVGILKLLPLVSSFLLTTMETASFPPSLIHEAKYQLSNPVISSFDM